MLDREDSKSQEHGERISANSQHIVWCLGEESCGIMVGGPVGETFQQELCRRYASTASCLRPRLATARAFGTFRLDAWILASSSCTKFVRLVSCGHESDADVQPRVLCRPFSIARSGLYDAKPAHKTNKLHRDNCTRPLRKKTRITEVVPASSPGVQHRNRDPSPSSV